MTVPALSTRWALHVALGCGAGRLDALLGVVPHACSNGGLVSPVIAGVRPDLGALDTRLIMRPLRNTERVMVNAGVERLLEKERTLGANITFTDIAEEVAGVYPKIMVNGEMDVGGWSCGMVAGLIHDIPTVKELIDRTMAEAEQLIRGRLDKMIAA